MAELIQQLLSITRLDQGTEGLRLEPLDLAALVEGVCAEQPYPRQRLFCQVGGAVWVGGDAGLLRRLLQNLIDNGFKYGTPQGHVWVTLEGKGNTARLQVRDDGIGIPEDQQEKVWQRFYQVDPSRRRGAGPAWAWPWLKKIAQLHGGTVTLDSAPAGGALYPASAPGEKTLSF